MVPDAAADLQDSGDSRAGNPARPNQLETLVAELKTQHARYLTVLEEALSTSAAVRREAAEEAARVLSSARQEADRLRGEALTDREAARDERARLAAARAQAEEALAHTRHALSAITAPLPGAAHSEAARPNEHEPPRAPTTVDVPAPPPADAPAEPSPAHEPSSLAETRTESEPGRRMIGNRVLFAAVVPPCLLMLGVFVSMAWHDGSASTTSRPLRASHLPPVSYELVSAPVSRPAPPELSAFAITAARPTWLRLTIDGKRGPGFVLPPGTDRIIPADRDLVIRTGDAGAISVSIAGRPALPMGRNGQVLSRHYVLPGTLSEGGPKTVATTGVPSRTAALPAPLTPEPMRAAARTPPLQVAAGPPAVSPVPLPPPSPTAARVADAPPDSDQITTAAGRWLTAYTRGDRRALADLTAPGFELLDERPLSSRFAANQQAERSLADAEVSVSGDGAVLSARMIERLGASDPAASDYTAYMSQVWIRQSGSWRLLGVRIRSADQVERMFKR